MKIKIGQIGIGHNHGEVKMKAIRKFPELFEFVGYSEDSADWLEKRGDFAGYRGLTRYLAEELIDMCDALLIECDVKNLTKYALMCVKKGKHIHMDKPASGSLEEFKEVLDIAKDYPYMDKKEIIEIPDVPKSNRYDTMISDFYEYIKGTKTNPYTYEHDYLVQKVLYEIIGGTN